MRQLIVFLCIFLINPARLFADAENVPGQSSVTISDRIPRFESAYIVITGDSAEQLYLFLIKSNPEHISNNNDKMVEGPSFYCFYLPRGTPNGVYQAGYSCRLYADGTGKILRQIPMMIGVGN